MTFNEAVKNKRQFLKDSSNYTKSLYCCIITPAIQGEYEKYISEYKNSPSSFIDESCKLYSSDSEFKVVVLPKKQLTELQNEEGVAMDMVE